MAVKGIAQITITDVNDITTSNTAPTSPTVGQLWMDTSTTPNKLKKWNGSVWELTGASSLAQLDPTANTTITTHTSNIQATANAIGLNLTTQTLENTGLNSRLSATETYITANDGKIKSAVSQTDINNSINALTIGGRNLVLNSNFEKTMAVYTVVGNSTIALSSDYYYQGTQSLKMSFTGINGEIRTPITGDYFNMCKGKVTTYSFKVKAVGSSIGKYMYATIVNSNSTKTDSAPLTLTGEWQTISVTALVPTNVTYVNLYAGYGSLVSGDIIYIDCVKYELGNKITDWTPAPEDVDSAIATVDGKFINYSTTTQMQSAIEQSATGITNAVSSTYETKANVATAISGIQIGSKNYARYSGGTYLDKAGLFSSDRSRASIVTIDNKQCLQLLNTSTNPYIRFLDIPILADAVYTFSIWIKGTTNHSATFHQWNGTGYDHRTFNVTTSWVKYSFTFTAKTTYDIVHLYNFAETTYITDWKFELGTKDTDWTPAPEDVDSAISGIQIGGRNLLKGTEFKNLTNWSDNGGTGTCVIETAAGYKGSNCLTLSSGTSNGKYQQYTTELNADYTLSCWVYVTTAGTSIIGFNQTGKKIDISADTTGVWTYKTITFKGTGTSLAFYLVATTAAFKICLIKLEKGTKATDYTVAPEDVDQQIVAHETRLSTAETKLTDSAFTVQINKNSSRVYKFRYIRDWINGSNINTNNHWVELQAINNAGVNLTSGKTPTSNASITNATYITDGVLTTTAWAGGAAGTLQYVQIDLGAIYQNIDLLKIWHYYGDGRTYHNTKTEVSEDGVNWLTVFDSSVSGEYAETQYGHTIQLNTNSISTSSTTINEGGVTINNGALTVKNSNSEVIIDGQHNMHKIMVSGVYTFTIGENQQESVHEIVHGLGYKPCSQVYIESDGYGFASPFPYLRMVYGTNFGLSAIGRAGTDSRALRITFNRNPQIAMPFETITVRYYIYKEVAI